MFGSDILDVAIGLVFVYLLLSLICSVLNEWIAALFSMRANNLEDGIRNLLKDSADGAGPNAQPLADRVYDHALVSGLFKQDWLDRWLKRLGRPSYIPSRTFALALLDVVAPTELNSSQTVADIRQAIENLPESRAREALLTLVNNAQDDVQAVRQNVENWFNDAMDRVAGWYKRKSQLIILAFAIVVASIANADSVVIVKSLRHNPALRASAIAAAEEYVKDNNKPATDTGATQPLDRVSEVERKLEPLHLPIGWITQPKNEGDPVKYADALKSYEGDPRKFPDDFAGWIIKLFGLLLTGIALSLGAPFWFDVLNKIIVIRSTVKPREKSPDEGSKDNADAGGAEPPPPGPERLAAGSAGSTSTALTAPAPPGGATVAGAAAAPAAGAAAPSSAAKPTGRQLLDLARKHIGETYIYGARVPLNNAGWRGPWDCAEFVSWCVYQLTGKLFGCQNDDTDDPARTDAYTGWWGRDTTSDGQGLAVVEQITIRQAINTPGALLLRLPHPNMEGHIVISDGQGGTVEAHSHRLGVTESVVEGRRWDMGIKIPLLDYQPGGASVSVTPPQNIYRLFTPYMRGAAVLVIQQRLKAQGIDPGALDGEYGPKTASAVYTFQLREGLVEDGEVGPETAQALGINLDAPPALGHFPGLDMGDYPGDAVMDAIFNHPYRFTGYYLNSPCHRDKPAGHWVPWMGHLQHLKEKGWGMAVVYVGQQLPGASKCGHNTLTRSQGQADADDAIAKAKSDGFQDEVVIFLDIEAMDHVPAEMMEYARAWVGRLLDDGSYKPGLYCHHRNADVLFAATRQEFEARNRPNEAPAFWVVNIKDDFDPTKDSPAASGVPYAAVWQGRIDIPSETTNNVTIRSLDHDVATTSNPSNV